MKPKPPIGARLQRGHPNARGIDIALMCNEGSGTSIFDDQRGLSLPANQSGLTWRSGEGGRETYHASDASHLFPSHPVTYPSGHAFTVFVIFRASSIAAYRGICGNEYVAGSNTRIFTGRTATYPGGLYALTDGGAGGFFTTSGYYSAGDLVAITVRRASGSNDIEWVRCNDAWVGDTVAGGAASWTVKAIGSLKSSAVSLPMFGGFGAFYMWGRALPDAEVGDIHADPYAMFHCRMPIELWSAATLGGGAPPAGTILPHMMQIGA